MYELAIGLSIMFAIMAYVSLRHSSELVSTRLGHAIIAGFALGWLVRAVEGFLYGEAGAAVIAAVCLVAVVLYGTPLVRACARPPRRRQYTVKTEVHGDEVTSSADHLREETWFPLFARSG